MDTYDREEIIKIVDEINYKLMDQLGDYNTIVLEYTSNTYSEAISIMDQVLWCSENEDRQWIEAVSIPFGDPMRGNKVIPAHYEDMMVHLCKKINKLLKTLNKIKL